MQLIKQVDLYNQSLSRRMVRLLRRETSFVPPHSGFTDRGSISSQGKYMNVPVSYHEVNIVLWALVSDV